MQLASQASVYARKIALSTRSILDDSQTHCSNWFLTTECACTRIIKTVTVVYILQTLVASFLEFLNFWYAPRQVAIVLFNAQPKRLHGAQNVGLLELWLVCSNHDAHRESERSLRA